MPKLAPKVASSIGTRATDVIESASLTTATRRRPTMSTITPENKNEKASGNAVMAPMAAAELARPVSSSTSQGNATSEMPLAMPLSMVEVSSTSNGHRRLMWHQPHKPCATYVRGYCVIAA